MSNPYSVKPASAFWRRSVTGRGPSGIDPIVDVSFQLRSTDKVATAGSCFAQHISRTLQDRGLQYLVTEPNPLSLGAMDENFGVFPARFGNIYTVRQLLQLFTRAFGLFEPADSEWRNTHGRLIDPFRPRIQEQGFATADALREDRCAHLDAVQVMFESCDVFIFTFGLTEGWESTVDGAVFPLAPGVVASEFDETRYRFHNFTVAEMEADMAIFIRHFRRINPNARIILTVSPVALIATYEDRHVLVSNTYSKAALRVVAESISKAFPNVAYFPSYEIIMGPNTKSSLLADDLREVTPEGVAHVMAIFCKHFLGSTHGPQAVMPSAPVVNTISQANLVEAEMRELQRVLCDEELIEQT